MARLKASGEQIGSLDCATMNRLVISQKKCVLGLEHLQLASEKSSGIGGHGEGFKVGINLLLRMKYKVRYQMAGATWKFSLQNEMTQRFKNMVVDIRYECALGLNMFVYVSECVCMRMYACVCVERACKIVDRHVFVFSMYAV